MISPNGTTSNGISPNVISPNGPGATALTLDAIDPHGFTAGGAPITASTTGAPLTGAGLVGSTWTGRLSNGALAPLRIDAAAPPSTGGIWSYRLAMFSGSAWRPLCTDAAGNPSFADSVSGTWNLAQGVTGGGAYHPATAEFTLACQGSSIAKCAELGYTPWTGHTDELAACVRALRGDFCGDGTPYTVSGTLVNIYDDAGIQPDGVPWAPEAAWTPDGAACISSKKETRFWQVAHTTPSCFPHALKPQASCGDSFIAGISIITELPPQ